MPRGATRTSCGGRAAEESAARSTRWIGVQNDPGRCRRGRAPENRPRKGELDRIVLYKVPAPNSLTPARQAAGLAAHHSLSLGQLVAIDCRGACQADAA